jgi:hypothetical protein
VQTALGRLQNLYDRTDHVITIYSYYDRSCNSIQLFGILGFKLEDEALVSTLGEAPEDMLLLQIVRQEIEATLASIRSPHGHLSIPDEKIVPHFESATAALETFLAAQYERRTVTSTIAINAITEFSMLGVVPDMADNVIVWVYKCLVNEQPQNHSGWLEALEKIAHETRSEELQTEVAIEHSQGVFGFTDVSRAYQHFDIADPQNVDDDLILGLYDIKVSGATIFFWIVVLYGLFTPIFNR